MNPGSLGAIEAPRLETERLLLLPMEPQQARTLVSSLLSIEALARRVPWMASPSADVVAREAFRIEMQCGAGNSIAWAIIEHGSGTVLGAVLVSASMAGADVEVLLAPDYWGQGFTEEATEPVLDWVFEAGPPGFEMQ